MGCSTPESSPGPPDGVAEMWGVGEMVLPWELLPLPASRFESLGRRCTHMLSSEPPVGDGVMA